MSESEIEGLEGRLNDQQKSLVRGGLADMERLLLRPNPRDFLPEFRQAYTKMTSGLMGTLLEGSGPFVVIMKQVNELGLVSETVRGVKRGPAFDKAKLVQAVEEAKKLVG